MNYYINVAMGLGGNLALSSVITQIKETYGDEHDFYISSPYFDCFLCNPNVKHVYKPNQIRDFIFDAKNDPNSKLIIHRLYDSDRFIKKEATYKTAWYEMLGIEPKTEGNDLVSKLDVYSKYPALKPMVDKYLKDIKDKGYKDFIVIQFEGGVSPLVNVPDNDWSKVPDPYDNEPLGRIYPRENAKEFIKLYMKEHPKTAIVNYTLPNQGNYGVGEFKEIMPYLSYYAMVQLPECKGIVCIDSSLQHLTAGLKPTTVIWGHSINADKDGNIICNNFGYDRNRNVVQPCRRDDILYFTALGASGARIDYISPEELLSIVEEEIN